MEKDKLSNFIKRIEELTKKPEKYLSFEENQANLLKVFIKNLYDFTKEKEYPRNKTLDVLKKLVIMGLDEEQVWQQIDLQNNSVWNTFATEIAYFSAKKESLKFPLKEKNKEVNVPKENIKNKFTEDKVKKKVKCAKRKSSSVDDKFFKLHEMENFLETIEKKEGEKMNDDAEEYDSDDLFSLSDDNEKQFYYNDFFDQPEEEFCNESAEASFDEGCEEKKVKFMQNKDDIEYSEESEMSDNFENYKEKKSKNNFNANADNDDESDDDDDNDNDNGDNSYNDYNDDNDVDNNDGDEDEDDDDDDNDDDDEGNNVEKMQPSTFETRQERLKSRIKNLEEEALKEKPWQLKGEVTASNRPQNSLLEEYVEFDIAARPAPILTEKSTLKLEDVIIQRIKDMAWDDVVRKIKPVENDIEYKKKLVLDQEKSKLSLAQIYENEYLKQLESKNEEMVEKPEKEPLEHQEIRIMMNNLFSKLDALSNFHFTPKLVAPEVKIISNLPAINMEEVAPVATSDAALLAPEEVKPKVKGDLIGKSERTKTDKNRERRKKKLRQKLKYKQIKAKAVLKLDNSNNKDLQNKKISPKLLQKITKSSNVTQLNETEGSKHVRSSNVFFSKLQDETKSLIKKKSLDIKKMKLSKKINRKKSAAR